MRNIHVNLICNYKKTLFGVEIIIDGKLVHDTGFRFTKNTAQLIANDYEVFYLTNYPEVAA